MASPMPNGTSPLPPSPTETSPVPKEGSPQAFNMEATNDQHNHTYTANNEQGRPSTNSNQTQAAIVPNWSPASLLNPKGASSGSSPLPPPLPPTSNSIANDALSNGAGAISFEFASADDDLSHQDVPLGENNHDGAATNGHSRPSAPNGMGMGALLDRTYNVEDRTFVPTAKRRKLDNGVEEIDSDKKQQFGSGSSGMLANSIKQAPVSNEALKMSLAAETMDLTTGEDDDLMIVEKPKEVEVCYGTIEVARIQAHKVPHPKPGMRALGGPAYWPLVKVLLRRPDGERTINIPVLDHTRLPIGRIDSKTARALCPLLDSAAIRLRHDARIPMRRKVDGEVPGQDCSRALPVEITLYGPLKHAKVVGRCLSEKGVTLSYPKHWDRGCRVVNPHAPAAGLTSAPASAHQAMTQQQQQTMASAPAVVRSVEEIRTEVLGIFDSMAKAEDLPEMEPHPRILTPLLKHQKQGLSFMTMRETPFAEQDDATRAHSIWQVRNGHTGVFYTNVITGDRQRVPPADTLGGILADMMGLGKTLSILSLIASTMDKAEVWRSQDPVQPRAPPEPKKPNANPMLPPAPQRLDLTKVAKNGKATLLVCPLSTIANWEEQIKQHVQGQTLNYHIYHGSNRRKDVNFLANCDLVITTYGSVSSEVSARKKGKDGQYPLEEISWFRIVLDEAHMIREQSTLLFKAICRLQASRRWAVTGTPVQNKLEDLGSLLMFLRLQPFDARAKFATHIMAPFKQCDPEIIPKIRILVDSVTLRRLKDKIDLPPRRDEVITLQFSEEEQRLYDVYEQSAKERVQILTRHQETSMGRKTYIHVLQSICRLRKICCHGKDLLNDDDLMILKGTMDAPIDLDDDEEGVAEPAVSEAKAYEVYTLMMDSGTDNCEGCGRQLSSIENGESEKQEDLLGYMTACLHIFCPECIGTFKDEDCGLTHTSNGIGQCPVCKDNVNFFCRELRQTRADAQHDAASNANIHGDVSIAGLARKYMGPHTKVIALLEDLKKAREESERKPDEPPIKTVVFSQWTSNLDLIEKALDNEGYKYCRLDGKMTRPARTFAMETFRDNDEVTVILVSVTAGGLGLNLTAASQVVVMEPQFNPAAEAQAVDRVHRLGQKRPVRCIKYIMRDSFEQKMIELQEKKTKLANLSMDRAKLDRTEKAKQKLDELRTLFK